MNNLISGLNSDGIVTVNRVVLRPEYAVTDLEERVAELCENVKTYHSETGCVFHAIRPPIPRTFGHPFHRIRPGQSERSDAGLGVRLRGWILGCQFSLLFAH